ncbi:MAG: hypothetical protein A2X12_11405 [Bacteroidetes bacterium GWE2_29_8]|nr:MAG: hypothetical protein A2X12_11405 [Bacteroidetes bacterium GWE2_29_8]OFY23058.1 MAG: hypothetical protein A2X02_09510 [Bacteroidetes bacterium GWF2_29_10]
MLINSKFILFISLLLIAISLKSQTFTTVEARGNSMHHFSKANSNELIRPTIKSFSDSINNGLRKKLLDFTYNRNLFSLESEDYKLYIDPYVNIYYGKEQSNLIWNNSRGISLAGKIGKKLSFYSEFYDTQGKYPKSIEKKAYQIQALPSFTTFKEFKDSAFDYSTTSAVVIFDANKHFNIRLGNDKLFIGNGYKSLFLTSNSSNYQFLNYNLNFKNISYSVIHTIMQNAYPNLPFESRYFNKNVNYYIVSYDLNKLKISFIESVVFEIDDTMDYRYNLKAINPIILTNTLLNSSTNNDNVLTGIDISYQLNKNHIFYMQTNLGLLANSKGKSFQIGYKQTEFIKNLYLLAEINKADKDIYNFKDYKLSFTNYSQAIANNFYNNFFEADFALLYKYKNFFLNYEMNYVDIDDKTNSEIIINSLNLRFLINKYNNLNIFLSFTDRSVSNANKQNSNWWTIGISTMLFPVNYNF